MATGMAVVGLSTFKALPGLREIAISWVGQLD